jgi:phenylalanyl-tRNA synthetase beta chain
LVWSDRSITTCRGRPQIGGGHKSLTLALRFRAPDRTLTEDQASAAGGAAGAELVGAVQRG